MDLGGVFNGVANNIVEPVAEAAVGIATINALGNMVSDKPAAPRHDGMAP